MKETACLLEHDDAADEGDPEAGAPCGGEREEVDQPRRRSRPRCVAVAGAAAEAQRVGREEEPRGEERSRRQEPRRPPHRAALGARDSRGALGVVEWGEEL
jgi:hypothetical protein